MPGYLLIKCHLTEVTWQTIKSIPKIIGFVGNTRNPVDLKKNDIKNIYFLMNPKTTKISSTLQLGTAVKINYGPFSNLCGTIHKINMEKKTLKVLVSF